MAGAAGHHTRSIAVFRQISGITGLYIVGVVGVSTTSVVDLRR
jgi:hypothetical protein